MSAVTEPGSPACSPVSGTTMPTTTMPTVSCPSMPGRMAPKSCAVCGDAAFGRNFGVPTCESCKAFFRRNMLKDSLFGRCDGQCEVTVSSRTHCKKCRLKKCYAVGMKRETVKKHGSCQKRYAPATSTFMPNSTPPSSTQYPPMDSPNSDSSCDVKPIIVSPVMTPGAESNSSMSPTASSFVHSSPFSHLVRQRSPTEMEDQFAELVLDLNRAYEMIDVQGWVGEVPKSSISEIEFVNLIEIPTRRIVKLAKNLPSFKRLSTEDQVALLKGGVMELTWLMSTITFDPMDKKWVMRKGDQEVPFRAAFADGHAELREMIQMNTNFSSSIIDLIEGDVFILKVMLAISLFSSDRPNLVSISEIQTIQEQYAQALYRYTLYTYPERRGLFAKVIQKLVEIREISEKHTQMLMSMNIGELRPLIVEVYDLSKHTETQKKQEEEELMQQQRQEMLEEQQALQQQQLQQLQLQQQQHNTD